MTNTTNLNNNNIIKEEKGMLSEFFDKQKQVKIQETYNLHYKEEVVTKLNNLFSKYEGRTLTRAQFKELLTEALNNDFRVRIDCGLAGIEVFDDIIYEFSELGPEITHGKTKEEQLTTSMRYFGCFHMSIYGIGFEYKKRTRRVKKNKLDYETLF